MKSIEILPWENSFAFGLPELDALNRHLVHLVNQLAVAVVLDHDRSELDAIFDALLEHADQHFKAEETLWCRTLAGDSLEERHMEEHGAFFSTLFCLNAELATRSPTEMEGALDYLVFWLAAHLLDADQRCVRIVLEMQAGLSLDAARARAAELVDIDAPAQHAAAARSRLLALRAMASGR